MFPETEFHKLGNRLMFLVVGKRIYHTENARDTGGNFLSLCNLNFPLSEADTLEESEKRYLRRSKKETEKFIAEQIGKANARYIEELERKVKKKEDAVFFFREICPAYDNLFRLNFLNIQFGEQKTAPREHVQTSSILEKLLGFDCAVINGRVYPLQQANGVVFAELKGQRYKLTTSVGTIDEIEVAFQKNLEEQLKAEAVIRLENGNEKEERVAKLVKELNSFEVFRGIKAHPHCYEFGKIGYDFSAKLVYWMIEPHSNETTGKRYTEGQSAVTLAFENKKFGSGVQFADREGRDYPFSVYSGSNCYGGASTMPSYDEVKKDTIEDKMTLLHTCADMVSTQHRFYQAPTTSDDSGDSY